MKVKHYLQLIVTVSN